MQVKKIHYVWLGGKPLPPSVKACIKSWRKTNPDFEIIQWNEHNFDLDRYVWCKEAIEQKMYAFAADFMRFMVLKEHGGLYLDTDVELRKDVTPILTHRFVTGVLNHHFGTDFMNDVTEDGMKNGEKISGLGINTGFIYSEPNHPILDSLLTKLYRGGQKHFEIMIIDRVMRNVLYEDYGLKYRDMDQNIRCDAMVYHSSVIASPKSADKQSVAIHWFDNSWIHIKRPFWEECIGCVRKNLPNVYRNILMIRNLLIHKS